jgi:hypothetical protein
MIAVCTATPKCFGPLRPPTDAELGEMLSLLNDPKERPVLERMTCVGKCERCGAFHFKGYDA